MKITYLVTSVIISLIVFLIMIGEDLQIAIILAAAAFVIGMISILGSKLILAIGDKINNIVIKVLYYVLLPIPLFWLWVGLITLLLGNYDPQTLGDAVFFLFVLIVTAMFVFIPYIQSLIVLAVRRAKKNKNHIQNGNRDRYGIYSRRGRECTVTRKITTRQK